jgi:hypothetical protein
MQTRSKYSHEVVNKIKKIDKDWCDFFDAMIIMSERVGRKYKYPADADYRRKIFGIETQSIDRKKLENSKILWWKNMEQVVGKFCSETLSIDDCILHDCPNNCGNQLKFYFLNESSIDSIIDSYYLLRNGGAQISKIYARCNMCGICEISEEFYKDMKISIISNHHLEESQYALNSSVKRLFSACYFTSYNEYLVESVRYEALDYVWSPPNTGGTLK